MTKKEFIAKYKESVNEIDNLYDHIREIRISQKELCEQYVAEHAKYKMNDIVESLGQYGNDWTRVFIDKAYTTGVHIVYDMKRIKKDGTPYKEVRFPFHMVPEGRIRIPSVTE